jgi:hypothetical protein
MPDRLGRKMGVRIGALALLLAGASLATCKGAGEHGAGTSSGGSSSSGGSGTGTVSTGGSPGDTGMIFDGGGGVPPDAGLPPLPPLTHVSAIVRANDARVTFDPYPGAVDYRVYVLPQASDVNKNPDGTFASIHNGTYRCAGVRAAPAITVDADNGPSAPSSPIEQTVYPVQNVFTQTIVDGTQCDATTDQCMPGYQATVAVTYTRSMAEATLGYAFADPVAGTVPVYAVGDPHPWADAYGGGVRTTETRSKLYVLDRTSYLAQGFRDDGVAFYAPSSATSSACGSGGAAQVVAQDFGDYGGTTHLYYLATSEEAKQRAANPFMLSPVTPAFYLCSTSQGDAQPVMRTFYEIYSNTGHDELSLGKERFERARCQGSTFGACATAQQALWSVHWSGITGQTQLVVEALDAGCPYQGLVGGQPTPGMANVDNTMGMALDTEPLLTVDQIRKGAPAMPGFPAVPPAPNGEVFLNGQFTGGSAPKPIARWVVTVGPEVLAPMDFHSNFSGPGETLAPLLHPDNSSDCGEPEAFAAVGQPEPPDHAGCGNDAQHLQSPSYDAILGSLNVIGQQVGELYDYAYGGVDFSPRSVAAKVVDNAFLYVVLDVSSFTTARRYPQIRILQGAFVPTEWLLSDSTNTLSTNQPTDPWVPPVLLLQTFAVGNRVLELELCDRRSWQVNNQCPAFRFERVDPAPGASGYADGANLTPHPEMLEHMQTDDSARFELFLSTKRAYVLFEGQPYGCADLANRTSVDPQGQPLVPNPIAVPTGAVTVSFGEAVYHLAAEYGVGNIWSRFVTEHTPVANLRHFDYFAIKSGVPAPAWDEARFPCLKQMHLGGFGTPEDD